MPSHAHIPDRDRLNFSWLVKLRWSSIAGQIGTILGVDALVPVHVPFGPLFVIVAIEFASNVACAVWLSRRPEVAESHLAGVMALDTLLLTGLLYFTGGPFNPFAFLYLVNIALAAVVLHAQWTWALVALALASLGALSVVDYWQLPLEHLSAAKRVALLQRGVWVAFAVAAAFIVHFLWRVTGALARRERELAEASEHAARQDRLASLATMVGGAAHELATPLGTIALIARELERSLARDGTASAALDDLRLIREQVARCRLILDQMAAGAGKSEAQALESITVEALLGESLAGVRDEPRVELVLEATARARELRLPPHAVAQALRSLITNAQDASPANQTVTVTARAGDDGAIQVSVEDQGSGMESDVLSRVGEPFFTTKDPGRGMGLGLFLTRAVIEKLGGSLSMQSSPGIGTRVDVRIPT